MAVDSHSHGKTLISDELPRRFASCPFSMLQRRGSENLPNTPAWQLLTDLDINSHTLIPKFTFIDLFAGIGGLRIPFQELNGKCVFACEWNVYAQKTYRANFCRTEEIYGDIRQIPAASIPRHDLLLAGFPCQPFSIAGVSKSNSLNRPHGFKNATQGTLFFEVARILD